MGCAEVVAAFWNFEPLVGTANLQDVHFADARR
jgi:hypothetical protein